MGSARYRLADGKAVFERIPFSGGRLVATSQGLQAEYHLTDHLGSIRAIANEKAEIVARYDYLPYGEQHLDPALPTSDDNDFRFAGKEWLERFCGLKLYDSQARLLDTDGRFLSPDPKSDIDRKTTPYIYCGGNPVMRVDLDGNRWLNADGKPMWNNRGYTKYATDEFKYISIMARATPTGRKAFDIIANGPGETYFEVNPNVEIGKDRNDNVSLIRGLHDIRRYGTFDGVPDIVWSFIKIYEGSIRQELAGKIPTGGLFRQIAENLPEEVRLQAAMASVLVHEAVHGTFENVRQNAANQKSKEAGGPEIYDLEIEPKKWQNRYLQELMELYRSKR